MISCQEYMNEFFGNVSCSMNNHKDYSKILAFVKFINYEENKEISEYLLNGKLECMLLC